MLDSNVDSLLNVPVTNSLVDYDAHCGFGDIIDDASLAVVDFVRHPVILINQPHPGLLKVEWDPNPF